MERSDVIELFRLLRGAGLEPYGDMRDERVRNQMVDAFYGQYKNITKEELEYLKTKLIHLRNWPRFYDVDDALKEYHRTSRPQEHKAYSKAERIAQRDAFCREVLGGDPDPDKGWVLSMAEKCAKRHFPDLSQELIWENRLALSSQLEKDYICDTCNGRHISDCPTGGHMSFLRIEPDCGLLMECVDCMPCGKALVPMATGEHEAPNSSGQRRGGGFTSMSDSLDRFRQGGR